jgi:Tol biopolymer transport system component/DNA-binding winged helix-turn-helix (wHTH) protein
LTEKEPVQDSAGANPDVANWIRFGVFEADLRASELRKSGQKVKLQEQPFQLLAMLLERPGEVITREELRSRLWPGDTFVDFDHGLNAAIKRLRDALGDSADNPRFVETLARRGYRFIPPVEGAKRNGAAVAAQTGAQPVAASQVRSGRWRIASAVLLVLFGTCAGWVAARYFNPKVQILERRLTGNPADDPILSAVISPDAKYLAFSDRSGLFVRVVLTGETHAVALPDGFRLQPISWFPDGSHVLTTNWSNTEGPSLWSVSVLGGAPRKIMGNAEARAVSPDGSQIAFVRGEMLHEEVWVMSADGDHVHKVFGEPGDMFGCAAWSRDGQLLAFVRFNYAMAFIDGQSSIWIVKPSGGLQSHLFSEPRLSGTLAWAADGRLIYSLAEPRPNQGDSNLWAIHIDPHNGRTVGEGVRLTSGPDRKIFPSLSSDGKQLAFLRWRGEPHVYVADLDAGGEHLSLPRALSLDEGRNQPYAWTPDGKSVLFTSDRDGPRHIFRQAPDQRAPDLLVGGPDSVQIARLNPEGTELMYLLAPSSSDPAGISHLMRMPLGGGTPQLILGGQQITNFQCARLPSRTCLLSVGQTEGMTFFTFDPVTGKEKLLLKDDRAAAPGYNWTLSPDGTMLATSEWRGGKIPSEIHLIPMKGGARRTLSLADWAGIASIDWSADGRSIWVSAESPSGPQALLSVDLHGRAKTLLEDLQREVGWAIQSIDGRHIAFWEAGGSSNAWVIEGF